MKSDALQAECHLHYRQHAPKERITPYGMVLGCWYLLGRGDAALLADSPYSAVGV